MAQTNQNSKLITAVVAIVVIAGLIVLAEHLKSQPAAQSVASVSSSPTNPTVDTVVYKNGSYSANENYVVPPGEENLKVSLTLAGGVVSDVQITNSQNDPTSSVFQQDFAAGYKNQVVGKPISSLHVSSIAGASDTTQAFNDALSQIRSKAQS